MDTDREARTRRAADALGAVLRSLVARRAPREQARRAIMDACLRCFGAAGLLAPREPVAFTDEERRLLAAAAAEDWSRVEPRIFGALFQASLDPRDRHASGAHFTSEADILRIVVPTLVAHWRARIERADGVPELTRLRDELGRLRVLDPACGTGDFLVVAHRELVGLDRELAARLARAGAGEVVPTVSVRQLFGIDLDPTAVELARLALLLAERLARGETRTPLADLERNIICDDALFCAWPPCDVIVGNPPFQAKNKLQQELGPAYVRRVRDRYPDVSGLADYCVYWLRRAHDELPPGGRAGLVGTNTIRQNTSRDGGLGYIVRNGGTITDAVSSAVWSGDAAVHVSIVNWVKGRAPAGKRTLRWQAGDRRDSPWHAVELDAIGPSLSPRTCVAAARGLAANMSPPTCYQGQTHGHAGFLVPAEEARALIAADPRNREVLFPFLIGDDLLGRADGSPSRHVIDFGDLDSLEARRYKELFARVKNTVLPAREQAARAEQERNATASSRANRHHAGFLERWWRLSWRRSEMLGAISGLQRYIVCVRVTKRPIFEFVSTRVRPNDALVVFTFDDDYSFGILQSNIHWMWFNERCSTLAQTFRYTSNTVYDAYPWPQTPSRAQIDAVARAAVSLRRTRSELLAKFGLSRRELYRTLEEPGESPLRDAHDALDAAVRAAYGMPGDADGLEFLLSLNLELAAREERGEPIEGPGLPRSVGDRRGAWITRDCVEADSGDERSGVRAAPRRRGR